MSHHANTQNDVAGELAEEWAGQPPDSVINGQNAEDCIACHGATSIAANGGMSEVQAMGYFFSTTDGVYTDSTHSINTDEWPNNACVACHNVPDDHPETMPTLAVFNSPTAQYNPVDNASMLCGQCHGTLRYPENDHRRMDAWKLSKHGHGGQDDVSGELSEEFVGSTPAEVIADEDCIGCHASTSVLLNGGISEADALDLLFTTEGGVITENTVPKNTDLWPEVSCTSCHNQHHPEAISYFNSGTKEYEIMPSTQKLCGQCHGNLRFPDTDHLSYNIEEGTGGKGVPDQQTMSGVQCVNCHMHTGDVEDTYSIMYGGHTWQVFVSEEDGSVTAACTTCHPSMTASDAQDTVNLWKTEFATLDAIANIKVAKADSALIGSTDSTLIKLLEEAKFNLTYAESDESGGVHNHLYTQALLQDAIDKSNQIISGIFDFTAPGNGFVLLQNYPNPFNLTTNIEYKLPKAANVTIEIYNFKGQKIRILLNNKRETEGQHTVKFDAVGLPSGIYFCNLRAGHSVKTMRMVLLH
ncbi:MAG: ammonia-forming cytochrome c nitrite reductase subunit c552 [Chlorobi bacterium]|nr:ammonia-forming cytochrome c nitrite reductase subunit c552 [Chlorobiota bacterium]